MSYLYPCPALPTPQPWYWESYTRWIESNLHTPVTHFEETGGSPPEERRHTIKRLHISSSTRVRIPISNVRWVCSSLTAASTTIGMDSLGFEKAWLAMPLLGYIHSRILALHSVIYIDKTKALYQSCTRSHGTSYLHAHCTRLFYRSPSPIPSNKNSNRCPSFFFFFVFCCGRSNRRLQLDHSD